MVIDRGHLAEVGEAETILCVVGLKGQGLWNRYELNGKRIKYIGFGEYG